MNTQKSVAVVAAMLITAAGMVGIVNYSNAAAAASSKGTINASTTRTITTLPTITVTPDPAVLHELRKTEVAPSRATSTSMSSHDASMPYYSFAAGETGA